MLLLSSSPALLRCIPGPPQGWSALHFSWCWAAEMFYPLCSIKVSGSCEGIHLSLMFLCFSGNCTLGTALLASTVLALTGRVGGFGCELTSVTLIFCLALSSDFSRVQVWRWWVKGGLLFWWWDSSDELQCVSLLHKGAAKFNACPNLSLQAPAILPDIQLLCTYLKHFHLDSDELVGVEDTSWWRP